MRIAIYARISIDPSKEKPSSLQNFGKQSLDNQLGELRKFAEANSWKIYDEYLDTYSGAKGKDARASFNRLFIDASQRKFDLVLFWALDRFSREGALKTLKYLEELDSYGVGWKSYSERYLDSAGVFKDVVVSIMATLAKQERIKISERTKAGLARVIAQGKKVGRPKVNLTEEQVREQLRLCRSVKGTARRLGVDVTTIRKNFPNLIKSFRRGIDRV